MRGRARLAAQNAAHDVTKRRITRQQDKNAPKVIAERPFVKVSQCFKSGEVKFVRGHFMKPSPDKIRMAADELKVA